MPILKEKIKEYGIEDSINSRLDDAKKDFGEKNKSTIQNKSDLTKVLRRFNLNGKFAKQGKWSIANGGNDLSF